MKLWKLHKFVLCVNIQDIFLALLEFQQPVKIAREMHCPQHILRKQQKHKKILEF